MPSLETTVYSFPSSSLVKNIEKIGMVEKTCEFFKYSNTRFIRISSDSLYQTIGLKEDNLKTGYSNSYYTWLAFFQETFTPDFTVNISKSSFFAYNFRGVE